MGKNLLIDDIRDEAMLAKRGVRNPGLSFTPEDTARNPEDAKRLLLQRGWDTVFLDNDLGETASMEGRQILRWILEEMIFNKWPKTDWPKKWVLVTDNSVAAQSMSSLLQSSRAYKPAGTNPPSWDLMVDDVSEKEAAYKVVRLYHNTMV